MSMDNTVQDNWLNDHTEGDDCIKIAEIYVNIATKKGHNQLLNHKENLSPNNQMFYFKSIIVLHLKVKIWLRKKNKTLIKLLVGKLQFNHWT